MSDAEAPGPRPIAWVDLMTPDPDAARRFYGELFGWNFKMGPRQSGDYTLCRVRDRNAAGMARMQQGAPFPSSWCVYFATADARETCGRIREHRGTIIMDPFDAMEETRLAFCADSTGAHFGLWEAPRRCGTTADLEHGAVVWHELETGDANRAALFYAAVFGLEARAHEGQRPGFTLYFEDHPVCDATGMGTPWPPEVPPHWTVYFAVADLERAVERAVHLGARILRPSFESNRGPSAVLCDPFGAGFATVQL